MADRITDNPTTDHYSPLGSLVGMAATGMIQVKSAERLKLTCSSVEKTCPSAMRTVLGWSVGRTTLKFALWGAVFGGFFRFVFGATAYWEAVSDSKMSNAEAFVHLLAETPVSAAAGAVGAAIGGIVGIKLLYRSLNHWGTLMGAGVGARVAGFLEGGGLKVVAPPTQPGKGHLDMF